MRIANIVKNTESEGPGRRFAIWFQGCPILCPGCCNPEMIEFTGGKEYSVDKLVQMITSTTDIEGISLLGGEPIAQANEVADLCEIINDFGLTIVLFTGFTLKQLYDFDDYDANRILDNVDLVIDGPFDMYMPENESPIPRRWVGSRNQEIHFFTDRYSPKDPRFYSFNTIELRLNSVTNEITINGWPSALSENFMHELIRKILRKKFKKNF